MKLQNGTFVRDIGLAPAPDRITVERLDLRAGRCGSEVADRAGGYRAADHRVAGGGHVGGVDDPAAAEAQRQCDLALWSAWRRAGRLRRSRRVFSDAAMPTLRWVTFTVTDDGNEFVDQMSALTAANPAEADW